jgi:hypothetical protein
MGCAGAKPGQSDVVGTHRITLVIGKTVAEMTFIERSLNASRETFARMEAAAMLADLASPLIIACCGIVTSLRRFGSISRCCGASLSPSIARRIASRPAQ